MKGKPICKYCRRLSGILDRKVENRNSRDPVRPELSPLSPTFRPHLSRPAAAGAIAKGAGRPPTSLEPKPYRNVLITSRALPNLNFDEVEIGHQHWRSDPGGQGFRTSRSGKPVPSAPAKAEPRVCGKNESDAILGLLSARNALTATVQKAVVRSGADSSAFRLCKHQGTDGTLPLRYERTLPAHHR